MAKQFVIFMFFVVFHLATISFAQGPKEHYCGKEFDQLLQQICRTPPPAGTCDGKIIITI